MIVPTFAGQVEDRQEARQSEAREREVKLSQVSLVIVFVFIFCHSAKEMFHKRK